MGGKIAGEKMEMGRLFAKEKDDKKPVVGFFDLWVSAPRRYNKVRIFEECTYLDHRGQYQPEPDICDCYSRCRSLLAKEEDVIKSGNSRWRPANGYKLNARLTPIAVEVKSQPVTVSAILRQ